MTGHNCVGVMRNAGHEVALGASGTAFARGGTAVFAAGFYLGRDFSGGPASLVGPTGSDAVEVSSATGVISAIAGGSSALTSHCSRTVALSCACSALHPARASLKARPLLVEERPLHLPRP